MSKAMGAPGAVKAALAAASGIAEEMMSVPLDVERTFDCPPDNKKSFIARIRSRAATLGINLGIRDKGPTILVRRREIKSATGNVAEVRDALYRGELIPDIARRFSIAITRVEQIRKETFNTLPVEERRHSLLLFMEPYFRAGTQTFCPLCLEEFDPGNSTPYAIRARPG